MGPVLPKNNKTTNDIPVNELSITDNYQNKEMKGEEQYPNIEMEGGPTDDAK